MARISPGLSPVGAATLFEMLYPSLGCTPMRDLFLGSYRDEIELTLTMVADEEIQYVA